MNDTKDGCSIAMIWFVTLVIAIIIGITTWHWLAPESAFGYIAFLIGWLFLSISGHFIARVILELIRRIT